MTPRPCTGIRGDWLPGRTSVSCSTARKRRRRSLWVDRAGGRSSWLLALSAPAIGLSYYRLRSTNVFPTGTQLSRVESLVTHHAGATLVHSIFNHLAAGATVKLVRGIATLGDAMGNPEELVDGDFSGISSNQFDVDVGIMATGSLVRAGLTLRNLTEPSFETSRDEELQLDRQARAGVALLLTPRWTAAVDFDLTRNRGPFGDVRTLALGTEARLTHSRHSPRRRSTQYRRRSRSNASRERRRQLCGLQLAACRCALQHRFRRGVQRLGRRRTCGLLKHLQSWSSESFQCIFVICICRAS